MFRFPSLDARRADDGLAAACRRVAGFTREDVARLPTLPSARLEARETFAADRAVRSVDVLTIRPDGAVTLVRIGPKGGYRRVHNFGTFGG